MSKIYILLIMPVQFFHPNTLKILYLHKIFAVNARTFFETAYYLAFLKQQIPASTQVSQLMRTEKSNS